MHAFNWVKEESHVEQFQHHFSLTDLVRDALYILRTPAIQN